VGQISAPDQNYFHESEVLVDVADDFDFVLEFVAEADGREELSVAWSHVASAATPYRIAFISDDVAADGAAW
jgi:hypothetical protein